MRQSKKLGIAAWQTAQRSIAVAFVAAAIFCSPAWVLAQPPAPGRLDVPPDTGLTPEGEIPRDAALANGPEATSKVESVIESIQGPEATLVLDQGLARLVRTRVPVDRISIANPNVIDVIQYGPTEFEFIGREAGITTMTLWFGGGANQTTLRYLVQVGPRRGRRYRQALREFYFGELERRINALFPSSSIQLVPVMQRLLVRGQARDPQEAAMILNFLQNQAPSPGSGVLGRLGTAVDPSEGEAALGTSQIIDMLDVPGELNIMLKVRVASVQRGATRTFAFGYLYQGRNQINVNLGTNGGGTITAIFDDGEVSAFFTALESNTLSKTLAEPNLVTLNGAGASFTVGGAFPVPTVVGLGGVGAAGTSFRGFGTQLSFVPQVIDKDRIRLQVQTSISAVAPGLSVGGVPGTSNQAVSTVVDLREGQWLAVGGLMEDSQSGGKQRVPLVGNLPVLEYIFSTKDVARQENEIVILVSPELVRPMDAENVPLLLPGMDVTEPTDYEFFVLGRYQGRQGVFHRSTVWEEYKHRMRDALRESRRKRRYQDVEAHYVSGDCGFSH